MAKLQHLLLAAIAIQVYVNAAPSEVTKLEDIAKVETASDATPTPLEESTLESTDTSGQRQKRWYDFGGFAGVPPLITPAYPTFVKRDDSLSTGVYGLVDDPLSHVYRRLHDIASVARQPAFPPSFPSSFPIYLPVLYLPQPCNCNQQPKPTNNQNGSQPDSINNRFPDMEDTRQNWGYVVNDDEDNDDGQDVRRPINFDVIRPNNTVTRRPPPVEHGTVQGDGTLNSIPPGAPPTTFRPSTTRRPPQNAPKEVSTNQLPTNCDAAVLSCCHRPEITFECFTTQGCPDVGSYGNPCEPNVILRVIERFQRFYQQRTGST
ncbi:uncharacterized protein LOC134664572 [Cydia fagiglandana]|uniref:uncharacterized protein LOC134664572 n=1 Tax=Cydia fagiglandana TaxID=1458189 RepID=UPI002FEDF381